MDSNSLINTRLGKYKIQAEIGRGGMGTVYRGYDPALDRHVAVKVLAPHLVWQQDFVERFQREAKGAARIRHPAIVTIHDVGQEGGWYYFVMEYLEGQSLTHYIQQQGALSTDETLAILRPLAAALDHAHYHGLVHRDIKPGNIIVSPTRQVTLTDFGIARAAQETRLTSAGTIVGTPEYMSPEQAQGLAVDTRSDQYSLAVVAYELLSGRLPFQADSTLALMYKLVHEPPPPLKQTRPDLSPQVEAVLTRALAKEPGARYATVSAFVEELEQALAGETVEAPIPMVAPSEEPPTVVEEAPTVVESAQTTTPAPTAVSAPTPAPAVIPTPTPAPVAVPTPAPPAATVMEKPTKKRRRAALGIGALGCLAVLTLLVGIVWALTRSEGKDKATSTPQIESATATSARAEETATPSPSPSPTVTRAATHTPTPTREATATRTPTRTPSRTPTRTPTQEATATSALETPTQTPTQAPTVAPPTSAPPTAAPPTAAPPTAAPPTPVPPTPAPPTPVPPTPVPPTPVPPTPVPPTPVPPTVPPPPPPTEPPPPPP